MSTTSLQNKTISSTIMIQISKRTALQWAHLLSVYYQKFSYNIQNTRTFHFQHENTNSEITFGMIFFLSTTHTTQTYTQYLMTNSLHHNLQFTEELAKDNTLNYLDITIHKTHTNIKISGYRKTTFTHTLIPYTSNHPIQQKYAAIR